MALPPPETLAENLAVERPESISDLLALAQAGDSDATSRLLELVRPHLEAWARGYSDPAEASESTADLMQEAWLKAWQKLDQFEAAGPEDEVRRRFLGWVSQIVHRLGLNRQRDRSAMKRRPADGLLVSLAHEPAPGQQPALLVEQTPSAIVCLDEETRRVEAAIASLPDELDRSIIQLRFFDGLSLRQISERLATSYERVLGRYHAALAVLENTLGDTA
jgi:RNA polymerase sigma-70 factor (ECF subfamily)